MERELAVSSYDAIDNGFTAIRKLALSNLFKKRIYYIKAIFRRYLSV
jgi:hypothetical protein